MEIAIYLGEPAPSTGPVREADRTIGDLQVRGRAFESSGVWREEVEGMGSSLNTVQAAVLKGYPASAHYAVEIVASNGASAAHRFALCLEIGALGRPPQPRDRLHVVLRRDAFTRDEVRLVERAADGALVLTSPTAEPIPISGVDVRGIVYSDQTLYDL